MTPETRDGIGMGDPWNDKSDEIQKKIDEEKEAKHMKLEIELTEEHFKMLEAGRKAAEQIFNVEISMDTMIASTLDMYVSLHEENDKMRLHLEELLGE